MARSGWRTRGMALAATVFFVQGTSGQCGDWVWQNGPEVGGSVWATTLWDPDGNGPLPEQLVVGGGFSTNGGADGPSIGIARWDGGSWHVFDEGLATSVYALTTWDPDGDGPLDRQVIAGGGFSNPLWRIGRWDGAAWQPIGENLIGTVYALDVWDPDGAGPLGERLVVGGSFHHAGGAALNHIAWWDGSVWQPFGDGLERDVFDIEIRDPDGAGPLAAEIFVGGEFGVRKWTGSEWERLGGVNFTNDVYTLGFWDPDGDGPLGEQLVAGGHFLGAGGPGGNRIATFDGVSWSPIGQGFAGGPVNCVDVWDVDGDGPLPAQLIAGGGFTSAEGNGFIRQLARWDGSQWQKFNTNTGMVISTLTRWDPDGPGGAREQMIASGGLGSWPGGLFTIVRMARWLPCSHACPGDANLDNVVDFDDINAIVSAINTVQGQGGGYDSLADLDGDGDVDFADLNLTLGSFRQACEGF